MIIFSGHDSNLAFLLRSLLEKEIAKNLSI